MNKQEGSKDGDLEKMGILLTNNLDLLLTTHENEVLHGSDGGLRVLGCDEKSVDHHMDTIRFRG